MTVARTLVAASLLFVMAAPARAASTGWTVFDVAPPGGSVASLAAIGGTDVWAVGLESGGACQYQTLAQRWTGSNWTVVPTPNVPGVNSVLAGVHGTSSGNVWAVGSSSCPGVQDGRTLIEHWDGTMWHIVASPNLGSFDDLNAVAAVSSDDAWAVGGAVVGTVERPLIEHWDGTAWTLALLAPGASGNLASVAARAADDVWAVGSRQTQTSDRPIALHFDGSAWSQIAVPTPGGTGGFLSSVVVAGSTSSRFADSELTAGRACVH